MFLKNCKIIESTDPDAHGHVNRVKYSSSKLDHQTLTVQTTTD